jgi:hypothetical protein
MTTYTDPTHQESLALDFWNKNQDMCTRAQARVLQAARLFLAVHANGHLPAIAIHAAINAVQGSCISAFVSAIRPHAANFVDRNASATYWAMVDAANHFCDATSAYWRYMTYDGRLRHLEWAVMEADQVCPARS